MATKKKEAVGYADVMHKGCKFTVVGMSTNDAHPGLIAFQHSKVPLKQLVFIPAGEIE